MYLSLEADLDDVVVSQDGTLAAYGSDETGRDEIYIRSFPVPGERTLVSQGGGQYPFWSPDGNTVYYWIAGSGGGTFMAARIQREPTPVVLSTVSLFTGSYGLRAFSDLHPDGDRLVVPQPALVAQAAAASETERFIVVVNWFEELRQRMGN